MRKLIIANWKMYSTLSQSITLTKRITNYQLPITKLKIVLCPSFIAMEEVAKIIKGTGVKLGAQDIFCCDARGAYTGEVGVDDLGELGVEYVIVGHSERRHYFNESDELVNQKLRAVLTAGMIPILCVGEPSRPPTTPNPSSGRRGNFSGQLAAKRYVTNQLRIGLSGVKKKDLKRVVIAYEPVWAIGTGKNDTPEDAAEMHKYIRKVVDEIYGSRASSTTEARLPDVAILYGGSVNSKNASAFLQARAIDGLLIGKASTISSELLKIVHLAAIDH